MRLVTALILLAGSTALAVPQQLTYEGHLTDLAGRPTEGVVRVDFALYDSATSDDAIWSEAHEAVEVSAGYFSLRLGDRVPLTSDLFAGDELYLGITVEGAEILPRPALNSVAFAHRAAQADDVAGQHIHPSGVSIGDTWVIDERGRWVGEPTGLIGPQGPVGETGAQGEQGLQGIPGERGQPGEQGAQGTQGLRGERGQPGEQGAQGIRGARGERGEQGNQGIPGVQGATGERGPQGEPGAAGARGPQGDPGAAGARGPQGDPGAAGARGPTGNTGSQGATGATGPAGPSSWTSQASCPANTTLIYNGFCMDNNWRGGARADAAARACLAAGAHLCTYVELSAACYANKAGVRGNMNGRWIGNGCGDDCVLCGNNNNDCNNFEGTCNKSDGRTYKCCYNIHGGAY